MKYSIEEFAEKLISVSDFSQGKAGKIISEVAENNSEYIIMKNNQPTAILISVKEYNQMQDKIAKLERFLEDIEDLRLLHLANERMKNPDINWTSFEDLVEELGFTMEEIDELAESVEIE